MTLTIADIMTILIQTGFMGAVVYYIRGANDRATIEAKSDASSHEVVRQIALQQVKQSEQKVLRRVRALETQLLTAHGEIAKLQAQVDLLKRIVKEQHRELRHKERTYETLKSRFRNEILKRETKIKQLQTENLALELEIKRLKGKTT